MFSKSLIKKEERNRKRRQEREYQVKKQAEEHFFIQNKITEKNKFHRENKK